MSTRNPPTVFFSLPRELRDQIYLETLSDTTFDFNEHDAESNPGTWFPVRRTSPGFYRPIIHMHRSKGVIWEHSTEVAPQPGLFQITHEAIPIYMRHHVMLEMTVEDRNRAIDQWLDQANSASIDMIQNLYVLVHTHAKLERKISKTLEDKLQSEHQPEVEGPIFKIELRHGGQEIAVRSRRLLANRDIWATSKCVIRWASARRTSPKGSQLFTGRDLVEVAQQIPGDDREFCLYVRERDILGVTNYKCNGITASELQLVETYDHVVATVRYRAGDLSAVNDSVNRSIKVNNQESDSLSQGPSQCECGGWHNLYEEGMA